MRTYGLATAVLYDLFSGERPFYRAGRLAAIDALRLSPGDRVLVVGCGTGLDLQPLAQRIGPTGTVVAIDRSRTMLRRAAARTRTSTGALRVEWPRARFVLADLTRSSTVLPPGEGPVDAVLAVNTLSLIAAWKRAWAVSVAAARPDARVAVADIGRPAGSRSLDVWSRVISFVGGGDLDARPWAAVERDCTEVSSLSAWRGHVQVRAGTLRSGAAA